MLPMKGAITAAVIVLVMFGVIIISLSINPGRISREEEKKGRY